MEQSFITAVILPMALGVIMLGMGMTLTGADFRRVWEVPKAMMLGLGNQLVLLPLVAFAVAWVFPVRPELAVGIVLIALCPGGATSNIISHLARADLALSVSLTAVSSVVTVLTIPPVLNVALAYFMGGAQAMQLPVGKTILQIFMVSVLPIVLGMGVRRVFPGFTAKAMGVVNGMAMGFFGLILVMAIVKERAHLPAYLQEAGAAVILLNVVALGLGYFSGRWFRLGRRQRTAISIETGIQNGTLAIGLALSPLVLDNAAIAIPAVIYSLTMFVTAAGVVVLARRAGDGGTRDGR